MGNASGDGNNNPTLSLDEIKTLSLDLQTKFDQLALVSLALHKMATGSLEKPVKTIEELAKKIDQILKVCSN
jgi:DNA-binding NtrC family response regulator